MSVKQAERTATEMQRMSAMDESSVQPVLSTKALHPKLRPDDLDCIYRAQQILCDRFKNPPSLLDLAHEVALNDYKLKIGFHQVFGTTVFGYLQQYRLEQAGQMLREQHRSVGEVARAVGYASRSSFVRAFRKKFGMSPSHYRT